MVSQAPKTVVASISRDAAVVRVLTIVVFWLRIVKK